MVFEYSFGVNSIADELSYREGQFPFEPKGFCQWGAKPQIRPFQE
jgi:2,3-dihydroxy-p-cumate/2,3-dihydroxybenzoate 3,4-dioxygenase